MTSTTTTRITGEWDVMTHDAIGDGGERMLVPSIRTGTPQKLIVSWTRGETGWSIERITVRGRLWLKRGGWGEDRTIVLDGLEALPSDVRREVELWAPAD
jgi:hypothetical protein